MGKMNELSLEQEELLWEQHTEHQRNELRQEGSVETARMIKYDLEQKYSSSVTFEEPSDVRPTALRDAIKIVEKYLS